MNREDLVALLAAHEPADVEEAADLDRMRDWAETLDYPFSREQAGAHFTASAVVVDAAGERTLLVHHRKSGSWFQPGGHFEPEDASAVAAARARGARGDRARPSRSARPGLLDVDIHWVPWDEHYHLDLRFHLVATGELAPDSAEVARGRMAHLGRRVRADRRARPAARVC